MLYTAIYGRKSVFVKDSISIEMQIEKAKLLCGPDEMIKEYVDEGFSGKNTRRPAFKQLIEDVQSGLIRKIIVYKIDRFSRSLLDFSETWELLAKHNVEFISVNEQFDTSTPIGKAMLFILMIFAQLERETVAERVTDNYYSRVKLGSWPGGPAPYGWSIGRIGSGLNDMRSSIPTIVRNSNSDVVEQIFNRYCEPGVSLGQVARELMEQNIPGIKSAAWTNVALARIIRNPVHVKCDADIYAYFKSLGVTITSELKDFTGDYGGLLVGKRGAASRKRNAMKDAKFSLGNWNGYIPSDIYLEAQYKLHSNMQVGNSGKGKHTWLTGLIKCAYCKMAMVVAVDPQSHIRRFKCSGRAQHICDHLTTLKLDEVENEVTHQIEAALKNCYNDAVIEEPVGVSNSSKIRLQEIEDKINNFMNCIAEGQANDKLIQIINGEVEKLLTEQKEILEQAAEQPRRNKKYLEPIEFEKLDFDNKKMVAASLIDKIYIYTDEIEIVWKL